MNSKAQSIIVLIAAVVAAFFVLNVLHFRFLPVHVVLYDALLDAVIGVATVSLVYAAWWKAKLPLTAHEGVLALAVGMLLCIMYAIVVPTVIDRSLSIYILEKLEQRGGGIRQGAFAEIIRQEFMLEHHLVEIRLTEQLNSHTITIEDGCVRLTRSGRVITGITRFYRTTLLPKKREILGRLTDDLTDPFRSSGEHHSYTCK